MTDIPLLLVHGSCHGAWCWERLVPELAARGISARALDLPGHGQDSTPAAKVTLDGYAEAILKTAARMGPRVVLLGHSSGGYAISAAALRQPDIIGKLIFLCAYLPVSGQSLSEMRKVWPSQPLVPHIRRCADGHSFGFDPVAVPELFYHDCPVDAVAVAKARLCPEPLLPQVTPIDLNKSFHDIEKHYIVCSNDRAVPPGYQRVMAKGLASENVSELPASHSPFLSMPDRLADRLCEILAR